MPAPDRGGTADSHRLSPSAARAHALRRRGRVPLVQLEARGDEDSTRLARDGRSALPPSCERAAVSVRSPSPRQVDDHADVLVIRDQVAGALADDYVIAESGKEPIPTCAATEDVVATSSEDRVVAPEPADHVRPGGSAQDVPSGGADDRAPCAPRPTEGARMRVAITTPHPTARRTLPPMSFRPQPLRPLAERSRSSVASRRRTS
jgi:hypothetical protein